MRPTKPKKTNPIVLFGMDFRKTSTSFSKTDMFFFSATRKNIGMSLTEPKPETETRSTPSTEATVPKPRYCHTWGLVGETTRQARRVEDGDRWWFSTLPGTLNNLRSTPHPVTVTTRIITFLVGNPYKPSFATVTVTVTFINGCFQK